MAFYDDKLSNSDFNFDFFKEFVENVQRKVSTLDHHVRKFKRFETLGLENESVACPIAGAVKRVESWD